ncbi:hypothetical protein LTR22_025545 [Elasticomyces elasticus]|nr:hypothetical protein LTR22_025545 [Elasticomyces elasticus]KAK4904120.1 hypothetical protein LTR49_026374 [Elasticomyces elasticus]
MSGALAIASAVTGNVGFMAGLLSLVVGTIDKTATTIETVRQCKDRLQQFRLRLEVCEHQLQTWEDQWGQFQHEEERLWGLAGAEQVRSLLHNVGIKHQGLVTTLCSAGYFHGHRHDDADQWRQMVSEQGTAFSTNQSRITLQFEPNFIARLTTALWKNSSLETMVKSLEQQVEILDKFSNSYYHKAQQHHGEAKAPLRADIFSALGEQVKHEHKAKRLWQAMDRAYDEMSPRERWALLLTPLDQQQKCVLETHETLSVDFLNSADGEISDGTVAARFRANYKLDSDQEIAAEPTNVEGTIFLSRTLKDDLRYAACLDDDVDLRRSFETLSSIEWARTALHIATWSILLGECRWMSSLCTCRVRSANLGRDKRNAIFTSMDSHVPSSQCQDVGSLTQTSLGLALAELCLARPICAQDTSGGESFCAVWSGGSVAPSTTLSHEQLLQSIKAKNHSYWLAIRHCLNWSPRTTPYQYSGAQQVKDFVANVVRPLHRHVRGVERHYQEHKEDIYHDLGLLEPAMDGVVTANQALSVG